MRTLCIDLDTSKAPAEVVDEDSARLGQLFAHCGMRYVADVSPSGGRHLYIPLAAPIPGEQAREIIEALGRLAPSLDPGPHRNPQDGCIRVPGSLHKRGGHQTLTTPLPEAYDVLRLRNAPAATAALLKRLSPQMRLNREEAKLRRLLNTSALSPKSGGCGGGAELPLRTTAATGLYDTTRYPSNSEARLAVLTHLAACGWVLDDVVSETSAGGQCAGLPRLFGTPERQARLLPIEWAKAIAKTRKPEGKESTRKYDTSHPQLTGGASAGKSALGIQQLINDLEVVLYGVLDARFSALGREGIGLRFTFRALLAYMRMKESQVLDVGCRTLALALGEHHSTAARLIKRLAAVSDGIVTKIADARHKGADVYLIDLPAQYRETAAAMRWRKGKIHGIRPVFRVLGPVAALAYEAIERARSAPTTAEVVREARISRTAAEGALAELAGLRMIKRDHDRQWHVDSSANLSALARALGAADDVEAQLRLHRIQRALWHAYLDRHSPLDPIFFVDLYDSEAAEYWLPPDDGSPIIWAS